MGCQRNKLNQIDCLLGTKIRLTQEKGVCAESYLECRSRAQAELLRVPSAGVHRTPEGNALRLPRKEGKWAPMGRVKEVHPDAGKGVAEAEVLLLVCGRIKIEVVGTPMTSREFVRKEN